MTNNDFDTFGKLYDKKDFNRDFKNIYTFSKWFSIIGHIASMALAYFMVTTYVSVYVTSPFLLIPINLLVILMLELLKRVLFSAFAKNYLHIKTIKHQEVWSMLILSVLSFSLSFYATIHGAQQFSSKEEEISTKSEEVVDTASKDVETKYNDKITTYEAEIAKYKELLVTKDDEQTSLESQRSLNSRQRNRIKDLKLERAEIKADIEKVEATIQTVKTEMNTEIEKVTNKHKEKTDKELSKNSKNTFFFVAVSCIVELLIIGGLFFMYYYEFRSYSEEKKNRDENPNFKKYKHYLNILECVYTKDSKENIKIPSINSIVEMCKIAEINVLTKDVTDALKLYSSLGIFRSSGNLKYYQKTFEEGDELLKEHFKITE